MRNVVFLTFAALTVFASTVSAQQSFEYDSAIKHWLALSGHELVDEDAFADWYIRQHQSQIHREYRNDEFEYRRRLEAAKSEGLDWLSNYSDKPYVIHANVEFGEYDFDREGFPIEANVSEGYFFYERGSGVSAPFAVEGGAAHESLDELPRFVVISFRNHAVMSDIYLNMAPDEAESFVAERRNRRGSVDRSLRMRLVENAKETGVRSIRLARRNREALELKADITDAAFYPDRSTRHEPLLEMDIAP